MFLCAVAERRNGSVYEIIYFMNVKYICFIVCCDYYLQFISGFHWPLLAIILFKFMIFIVLKYLIITEKTRCFRTVNNCCKNHNRRVKAKYQFSPCGIFYEKDVVQENAGASMAFSGLSLVFKTSISWFFTTFTHGFIETKKKLGRKSNNCSAGSRINWYHLDLPTSSK